MSSSATSLQSRSVEQAIERAPARPTRFLGRFPILDSRLRLFGYELVLSGRQKNAGTADTEQEMRTAVDHWLMLMPESTPALGFVRCTRAMLVDGIVTLLPPASTVLEIAGNIRPDAELISSCLDLKRQGYRMALCDFDPQQTDPSFIVCADFVKADFPAAGFQLRHEIHAIAAASRAQLIAENIENEIQMRIALGEGWEFLQGYFFASPIPLPARPLPQNHLLYLKVMSELNHDPADLRKLEKLISTDASLCYRVLRLANSALQARSGVVTTIREALMLVGDNAIRRMITVAMAGMMAAHRAPALVSMAIIRARFCELVARSVGGDPAQYYLLGIISLLDVLLETSLERVLEAIPISPAMKSALMGDQSEAGLVLALLRGLEACDWQGCEHIQEKLGISEGAIAALYVESLKWASAMYGEGAAV